MGVQTVSHKVQGQLFCDHTWTSLIRMGLQVLIAFQLALQVCMGLQIISGPKWHDVEWDIDNEISQDWKHWDLPKKKLDGEGQGSLANPHSEEKTPWVLPKKKLDGGDPLVTQSQTSSLGASCSCAKVLLSSLGPAANFQPQAMGNYTMAYTSYNNHPSYRQNYGRDFRLYYAPTGWLIRDHRGAPTGYIHNADHSQACPYTIPSGWMFYSTQHGAWYPDTTLVLRCITP